MSHTQSENRAGMVGAGKGLVREPKHIHDGKTLAAWVGSILSLVAFIIGGVAVVLGPNWTLFIVAAALAAASLIATMVLRALGHGAV